jgi:hypothetical protein
MRIRLRIQAFSRPEIKRSIIFILNIVSWVYSYTSINDLQKKAVLRIRIQIRIRIHIIIGLLDLDPLVRGMDPDANPAPDPSITKQK